jgi:hypothetical protein
MSITNIETCLFNYFVFCYLKLQFLFLTVLVKVTIFISVLLSIVKLDNRHFLGSSAVYFLSVAIIVSNEDLLSKESNVSSSFFSLHPFRKSPL